MDYELWDNFFPGRLHSTKEIIFFLENIDKVKELIIKYPKEIVNIIFGDIYHSEVSPLIKKFLKINDFSVFNEVYIEITSRKVLLSNEAPINNFYGNKSAEAWKENIKSQDCKDRKKYLKHLYFLNTSTYCELDNTEIKKDIQRINELVKLKFNKDTSLNIITALNLKLKQSDNYIPERSSLVDITKHVASDLNIKYYDPGAYIENNYEETFMEDYALDSQHFNSILKYEKVLNMFNHKKPKTKNNSKKTLKEYNLI